MNGIKVGDWVVRKPEHRNHRFWLQQKDTPAQVRVSLQGEPWLIQLEESGHTIWDAEYFTLVELTGISLEDFL